MRVSGQSEATLEIGVGSDWFSRPSARLDYLRGMMPHDPEDAERRRKLQELEQNVPNLVREDLRKEIHVLLAEIHEESLKNKGIAVAPTTRTLARFASLLGVLYIKTDIQTRRIVRLTLALLLLTLALLIFTAYLSYDAYLNEQRAKRERKDQIEKANS